MTSQKPINFNEVVRDLDLLLKAVATSSPFPSRLQRASLNETWFSDMLAWLLDVKAHHGYNTAFARQFLKRLAEIRTNPNNNYIHRNKHLRFGKTKINGTLPSHLKLGNSAVFREFYLTNSQKSAIEGGSALCDVAFLDLDSKDGIFVGIENKLFTTNRKGQLESYYNLIESKYHRANVLEYVFLTLTGEAPFKHEGGNARICDKAWVKMSWVYDILEILNKLPVNKDHDVQQLRQALSWLKTALDSEDQTVFKSTLSNLFTGLVAAASECIVDELERLNEGARGEWKVEHRGKGSTRILHTSKPKTPLYVGIMPNLSIALYNKKGGSLGFDKLLIPFGSNPDQIFNLMDFAARDIFSLHFGPSYKQYLGKQRRLTSKVVPARKRCRRLFHFVSRHRQEIQLLVPVARRMRIQEVEERVG